MAFCHWLGTRLGHEVSLPTEYQWQPAATGGDHAMIYPWGAHWEPAKEPWRANTLESGLQHKTAVGLYPLGASPSGVLDMAGNLWEWCLNAFDDPDDTRLPAHPQDRRAVRGGCWGGNLVNACSAFRNGDDPDIRSGYVRFRVVHPPPGIDR